jgi:hypothetical protein
VLGNFPIHLICPAGLDVRAYKEVYENVRVTFIAPFWQSSYRNFNLLKMDPLLYQMYQDYQYVLFYELDAWVFNNELAEWCGKNYDFIGAPWFEGEKPTEESRMVGARNGGFSLRKVSTSLKIARRINKVKRIRQFWYSSKLQAIVRFEKLLSLFHSRLMIKNAGALPQILFPREDIHEDHYWAEVVESVFSDFDVAPVEEAIKFSFEVNPALLYKLNSNRLPFGCHAWEKYDPGFWSKFIMQPSIERVSPV